MTNLKYFVLIYFLFFVFSVKSAVKKAHPDSWVKSTMLNLKEKFESSEIEDGFYYMLHEEQMNLIKSQHFYHFALKVTSSAGVQNASNFEFSYDPSYEKFTFHTLKIFRNGNWIDKLIQTEIKELQREKDLEKSIYDGRISVILIIDDVRPGDIIDYSYTIQGSNPVHSNYFYCNVEFSYFYKLNQFQLKFIKPINRKINIKEYNLKDLGINFLNDKQGESEIYTWQGQDIKGLDIDPGLPYGFWPYYNIEFSEFTSWKEVNYWAKKLFTFNELLSPTFQQKILDIKANNESKKDQMMCALRFVQNQIRYMGFEIGPNSHKPLSYNKVFALRYGDCKDKSTLLCEILNQCGIKAYPAFVNTNMRSAVKERLISPFIFNHCVVKVELNDSTYWFDPTISYQGGKANKNSFPNYQLAFVVGGRDSLEVIPTIRNSKITINENYVINDYSGKAGLKVYTDYKGSEADNIRYYFANNSAKNICERYTDFYKTYFPKIESISKPEISDDTINNILRITEEYKIDNIWVKQDSLKSNKTSIDIYLGFIMEKLNQYNSTHADRKMPLYLEYPLHIVQRIRIDLPEDWEMKPTSFNYKDEFCFFKYSQVLSIKAIDIIAEYQTFADQIPSGKTNNFLKLLSNINQNYTGVNISRNPDLLPNNSKFKINWLMVLIFIMLLGIMIYVAVQIYRKNKKDINEINIIPKKLGGWLIFPIIGLFVSVLIGCYKLFDNTYFNLNMWNELTTPGNAVYSTLWAPALILELLFNTYYIVFCVMLIFMVFTYDKRFPNFMIFFYIIQLIYLIITLILLINMPIVDQKIITNTIGAVSRSIITSAIWIPYFRVSKRCKETFIL